MSVLQSVLLFMFVALCVRMESAEMIMKHVHVIVCIIIVCIVIVCQIQSKKYAIIIEMPAALNRSSAPIQQQKKKKIQDNQAVQKVPRTQPIFRIDVTSLDAKIKELVTRFILMQPPLITPSFVIDTMEEDSVEKKIYNMISKYTEKILMLYETGVFPSQCFDPALSEHTFKIGQYGSPLLLQLPDRLMQMERVLYFPNVSKRDMWRKAFDSRNNKISMLSKREITPEFLEMSRCEKTKLSCNSIFIVAVYKRPPTWGTNTQIDQLNIYLHNTKQNSQHFPALREIFARKFNRFPQYYDVQERTFILTDTSTGVPVDAYFFDRLNLDVYAEQNDSSGTDGTAGTDGDDPDGAKMNDNSILEMFDAAIKSQGTMRENIFDRPGDYSNLLNNYVYGTLLADGDLQIITI